MKRFLKFSVLALLISFAHLSALAQTQFYENAQPPSRSNSERNIVPAQSRSVAVNLAGLQNDLRDVPMENTAAGRSAPHIIMLPLEDGSDIPVRLVESPILEDGIAAEYPAIKTYAFSGLENPSIQGRIGITKKGLHGVISTGYKTIYIDPYSNQDPGYSIVYDTKFENAGAESQCVNEEDFNLEKEKKFVNPARRPGSKIVEEDGNSALRENNIRRDYTVAIGATGEYTQFQGGTVADATAGIATTLNRINFIVGRDFSARYFLSGSNSIVVFADSLSDPYNTATVFDLLTSGRTFLNLMVSTGLLTGIDLGHTFSQGSGGGLALVGALCSDDGDRMLGATTTTSPTGNGWELLVAHEFGHQMGASHTWNALSEPGCSATQRSQNNAVEPGNGSTIMSYAATNCNGQNYSGRTQFYHARSIANVRSHILVGVGGTCATETSIINSAPILVATDNGPLQLPKSTPFYTETAYSDPNSDPISYSWEGMDTGTGTTNALQILNPSNSQPLARAYDPTSSGRRDYPPRAELLSNNITIGNVLPDYERTMKLRCYVRDNYVGGACNSVEQRDYEIVDAGPLRIFSQSTNNLVLGTDQMLNISWLINDTDLPPLNTQNLRLKLSLDGGFTFPIVLLESTANDAFVSIPLNGSHVTDQARIMLEPLSGHTYYAINEKTFEIEDRRDLELTQIILPGGTGCNDNIAPQFEIKNNSEDLISTADIKLLRDGQTVMDFTWTGLLPAGESTVVTPNFPVSFAAGAIGTHELECTASLPDVTEDNMENNVKFRTYSAGERQIKINVVTDRYGDELSWDIRDFQDSVVLSSGAYPRYTNPGSYPQPTESYCLNEGCYKFTAYDSTGDGICCFVGAGFITLEFEGLLLGEVPVELWEDEFAFEFCLTFGCTDPLACNFDSDAFIDEGGCIYGCAGCTDPDAYNWTPSATIDDGSCEIECEGIPLQVVLKTDCFPVETSWTIADENGQVLIEAPEGFYPGANEFYFRNVCLEEGCYVFQIKDSGGDGLSGEQSADCTNVGLVALQDDPGNTFFLLQGSEANFGTITAFEFCITAGCGDVLACNYEPDTNGPDSACDYSCVGCTDPLADNFSAAAATDDGSCVYACTEPSVFIDVLTDCFPEDLSWEILDANGALVQDYPVGYMSGNALNTFGLCLPDGCYTFVLNDSFGDGLGACGQPGNVSLSVGGALVYDLVGQGGDDDFGSLLSVEFCVGATCVGDIDGDSSVAITDLLTLVSALGCQNCTETDLDNNGPTAISDLLLLISLLGTDCP